VIKTIRLVILLFYSYYYRARRPQRATAYSSALMAASFLACLNITTILFFVGYGDYLFPSDAEQWLLRFFICMGALIILFLVIARKSVITRMHYEERKYPKAGWLLVVYIIVSIILLFVSFVVASGGPRT
jgi:threonine/homoserine/homoserine lactone efflux protein